MSYSYGQRASLDGSGPLGEADDVDRVFPIRSALEKPQPSSAQGGLGQAAQAATDIDEPPADLEAVTRHITARFQHIETPEGHCIVTGLGGMELQRCEDEPIHVPGSIQSYGALVALQQCEDGRFDVRIVSENSKQILGHTPDELFNLSSFTDILSSEWDEVFGEHVQLTREEAHDLENSGSDVFTLEFNRTKYWVAMHASPDNGALVICEFELEDDKINPISTALEETLPPASTLESEPTESEYAASTDNPARPLRKLASARRRRGEAAALEIFSVMSQINDQLRAAEDLPSIRKISTGIMKELTAFHRVMTYQFDEAWNGQVVAELVDPRATKDLYMGLHFPASDIPQQARKLYKVNKVRLLYDRDQETARLVCKTREDLQRPLDMTHCQLRAMSPIHVKYLKNMQVRASMSVSILAFGELWGLISCHSYGPRGTRVSFPVRKMCRLVGDSISRNIERISYATRLHARKLINTVPTEANPRGYIVASSNDLLKLFDADFGLLSIRDETKILGVLEDSQEALAVLEYFRLKNFLSITISQDIRHDFPDLKYSGFSVIAGVLLVPMSSGGKDFIVFFRKGQLKNVHWAGNPHEKMYRAGASGYLEPRTSFKSWRETVVGKSRKWTKDQVETAAVLCLVYGKFIEIWREKEAALQSSQLTRLLLSNASHEVRTPLNAIINYLEIALEGPFDSETRDNLTRSHSASKSLIYVINDLLDLTRAEVGKDLVQEETFDLQSIVHEACGSFESEARRKGLHFNVGVAADFPKNVVGDNGRVYQALSNITSNAVQHTSTGSVLIECLLLSGDDQRCEVEIVIADTGSGMSVRKLDILFRELEEVQTEDGGAGSKMLPVNETVASAHTLGLGLAVVARIVKNMNGQLRIKSDEGVGTRFALQFSFSLPAPHAGDMTTVTRKSRNTRSDFQHESSGTATSPSGARGENELVAKSSRLRTVSMTRRSSYESQSSMNSSRSALSGKSEIDRLVSAISGFPPEENSRANGRPSSVSSQRGAPSKSMTFGSPEQGAVYIEGSGVPLKNVKTDVDAITPSVEAMALQSPSTKEQRPFPRTSAGKLRSPVFERLNLHCLDRMTVLVAEDDPINCTIVRKRLERTGHKVVITKNGEECAIEYSARSSAYDVVLMDMQMPICDGTLCTRRIREEENSRTDLHGHRIPIIAVSASLQESKRKEYQETGFDGWILKPIFFDRLERLLHGIRDPSFRSNDTYSPGQWEKGGWFQ